MKYFSIGLLLAILFLFSCKSQKENKEEVVEEVIENDIMDQLDEPRLNIDDFVGEYNVAYVSEGIKLRSVKATVVIEKSGRVSGFNGCNTYTGMLNLWKPGTLIQNVGSTRRACENEPKEMERLMMEFLRSITDIKNNHDVEIEFFIEDLMAIRATRVILKQGKWKVTSIEGKSMEKEDFYLEVFLRELKGKTECNSFSSKFHQEGNKIRISDISSTEMACPGVSPEMEINFHLRLMEVTNYKLEENMATFYSGDKVMFTATHED